MEASRPELTHDLNQSKTTGKKVTRKTPLIKYLTILLTLCACIAHSPCITFAHARMLVGNGITPPPMILESLGRLRSGKVSHYSIANNNAYLIEQGLKILNLNNPAAPQASGILEGISGQVISLTTETLFSSAGHIVDVSRPTTPTLQSRLATGMVLAVNNDRLYAATGSQLEIYDVRDRAAPAFTGTVALTKPALSARTNGNFAYVLGSASLETDTLTLDIVDVTLPSAPVLDSSYPISRSSAANTQLEVDGAYAYLMTEALGLNIIDISDSTQPGLHASLRNGVSFYAEQWQKTNQLVFALRSADLTQPPTGLDLIDVSNPLSPTLRGVYPPVGAPPANYFYFVLEGNRLYLNGTLGLEIIDVSNPADPKKLAAHPTLQLFDFRVVGDYLYSSRSDTGEFLIFNVSNPTSPTLVGAYEDALGTADRLNVAGSFAITSYGKQLKIVDISDSSKPAIVATHKLEQTVLSTALEGNTFCIANVEGVRLFDVSNPRQLVSRGSLSIAQGWNKVIALSGSRGYLLSTQGSNAQFTVLDITNINQIKPVGSLSFTANSALSSLAHVILSGNTVYAHYGDATRMIDVRDVTKPVVIGTINTIGPSPQLHAVQNGHAFFSAYVPTTETTSGYAEVVVFNVSNPQTPAKISALRYTDNLPITGIHLADGRMYVATGDLEIVDFTDPGTLTGIPSQTINPVSVGASARSLYLKGDTLYALRADALEGLDIYRVYAGRITGTVTSMGGVLSSTLDTTHYLFPAGLVSTDHVVTHTARLPLRSLVGNGLTSIGHAFEVTGTATNGQLAPLSSTFSVTVQYAANQVLGVIANSLALYRWNGSQWVKEANSGVDLASQAVTAPAIGFGSYAVLGQSRLVFLPAVHRE